MAFMTRADVKGIIKEAIGPDDDTLDTLVETWCTWVAREIGLASGGTFVDEIEEIIDVQSVYNYLYSLTPAGVLGFRKIFLLQDDDVSVEEHGELSAISKSDVWALEHLTNISSQDRQPTHWCYGGVDLPVSLAADNGSASFFEPRFQIWPQPTTGEWITRKMRVFGLAVVDTINHDTNYFPTLAEFPDAFINGVLRYARLYAGDRAGYLMAAGMYRETLAAAFPSASWLVSGTHSSKFGGAYGS
jgi:hypothetical protein